MTNEQQSTIDFTETVSLTVPSSIAETMRRIAMIDEMLDQNRLPDDDLLLIRYKESLAIIDEVYKYLDERQESFWDDER